jgi:hypothetical protein
MNWNKVLDSAGGAMGGLAGMANTVKEAASIKDTSEE